MSKRLYFNGVPTDPYVKRIRNRWPDDELSLGQEITKEEVFEVINKHPDDEPVEKIEVDSNRFRTITSRWRRLVENGTGKVIKLRNGVFRVLTDGELVDSNDTDLRGVVRKTKKVAQRNVVVDVSKLTDDEKKRHDKQTVLNGKLLVAAAIKASRSLPEL